MADTSVGRPFVTDFCTLYPEGTKDDPSAWKHCCIAHDLFMWAGGEKSDRVKADLDLKECVIQSGYEDHANRIYLGVRLGSLSPIKFEDKAWGNAWIGRERNAKLSEEETFSLIEQIENHPEVNIETYQHFRSTLNGRLE